MILKNYTFQALRNAIEIELQKTDDVKLAAAIAIKRLSKDPGYYESMQKARMKKYKSKKPDGKGGWIYEYDKKSEGKKEKGSLSALIDKYKKMGTEIHIIEKDDFIELSSIKIKDKGKGLGSKVMNDLIAYADSNSKTITLTPTTDFGASSVSRLKKFYKKFGFVENKGRNKDYSISDTMYRESKMNKAKDISKLTKKVITNKRGHKQTVYVGTTEKKETKEKADWIKTFASFFGFKDRREVMQKVEKDYKDNDIGSKYGVTWDGWKNHIDEYVSNKEKWDNFFSGKKEKKPKKPSGKPSGPGEKKAPKKKKTGLQLSVMKEIYKLYGSLTKKKDTFETMPEVKKEKKKKSVTIKTENESKIEVNATFSEKQKKEQEKSDEIQNREGYYNEKPSEIMNVGNDVWGAVRHNYDTYEKFDADMGQMESDGTATAYVTKKNLIGDYGLANKDERVANGETEYKVLASFTARDYLPKVPPDDEMSRQKYMEFVRALIRLDDNTDKAQDFFMGLSEIYQRIFPQTDESIEYAKQKHQQDEIRSAGGVPMTHLAEKKDFVDIKKIVGSPLKIFLDSLANIANRGDIYSLDRKERKQFENLSEIILSEGKERFVSGTESKYEELKRKILGATKAAGIKVKKGDTILLSDSIKENVYITQTSFDTPENNENYHNARKRYLQLDDLTIPYNFDDFTDEEKREFGKPIEDFFKRKFDSKKEARDAIDSERERLRDVMSDNLTRTRFYPEESGQVVKAGKKKITVSFTFPDGKIRTFNIDPANIKQENIESIKKNINKKSTKKVNLYVESKVERVGGKDLSNMSVTELQSSLSDEFGFKSLQYGNSMPMDEREYHTKWSAEAFFDLSELLDLPINQISANGKLGMAYGARGKGGSFGRMPSAIAHYEQDDKMINLTRGKGFGSLAHEWGHFMDNILSDSKNDFISSTPRFKTKRVKSEDEIKHGSIFERKFKSRGKEKIERYFYDSNAENKNYPFVKLDKGQDHPGDKPKYFRLRTNDVEVKEPVSVPLMDMAREISKMAKEDFEKNVEDTLSKMDKDSLGYIFFVQTFVDNPYWKSRHESFARAFECYISDKLEDNGRKNTYLASKKKTEDLDGSIVYPQGETRKKLNKLFDKFFNELRKTNSLQKAIDAIFGNDKIIKISNPKTNKFKFFKRKK
jgi:hypothetical protein